MKIIVRNRQRTTCIRKYKQIHAQFKGRVRDHLLQFSKTLNMRVVVRYLKSTEYQNHSELYSAENFNSERPAHLS